MMRSGSLFLVALLCLWGSLAWAAPDPDAEPQPAPEAASEAVEEAGDAQESEDDSGYADSEAELTGKIKDGRKFVWAAYGVSWAVLLIYSASVIRRWRVQCEGTEEA